MPEQKIAGLQSGLGKGLAKPTPQDRDGALKRDADTRAARAKLTELYNNLIHGKATPSGVRNNKETDQLVDRLYRLSRRDEYLKLYGNGRDVPEENPELEELQGLIAKAEKLGTKIAETLKCPTAIGETFISRPTAYAPIDKGVEGGRWGRKDVDLTKHTLDQWERDYDLAVKEGYVTEFLQKRTNNYVAIAMDHKMQDRSGSELPYGSMTRCSQLEEMVNARRKARGAEPVPFIPLAVVDSGGAFVGKGKGRFDICMDEGPMNRFAHSMAKWTMYKIDGRVTG